MSKENVTKFIEIGPGKVLSGLINRISKNFNIKSINEIGDLSK
jgi:malonyl CoA-acyl carrier protein transacylase